MTTLVVLALYWTEPLLLSTRLFHVPQWLTLPIPILLLAPFVVTTFSFRRRQPVDDPFPEAVRAEQARDWDRAFAIYRDTYLARHCESRLIRERICGILIHWDDFDRALRGLQGLIGSAPSDRLRAEYAVQSAELLAVLGSKTCAMRLLKDALPLFTCDTHRTRIFKKITDVWAGPATGVKTPAPRASTGSSRPGTSR
jgi:hypothetical protein